MQLTFKDNNFVILKNGQPHTVEMNAVRHYEKYADKIAKKVIDRAFVKDYGDVELPPLEFLDAHQREGIKWILRRSRTYLAHAPGAGKTCQATVASCLIPLPGVSLFIVPPSLVTNWKRETKKWTELMGLYLTIGVIESPPVIPSRGEKFDILIVSDTLLTNKEVYRYLLYTRSKFIAVDEASRFKEASSQRSVAFYGGITKDISYPGLFQNASYTVFLDGSPMPNRPAELWAPTYALDPESIDCMGFDQFGFKYCGAHLTERGHWEFKGSSREDELREKLQREFMHVVMESRLSHPERKRSILYMEGKKDPTFKAWEKKALNVVNLKDLTGGSDNTVSEFRKFVGLKKIQWVATYVRDRLGEKNESILLFAWHREVLEGLSECLKDFNPFVIYGGVPCREREKALKEFNEGRKKLILGNIQACGRGHNIPKADRVIFAEYAWADELNKQCEKRASRKGRDKNKAVRCEYVVMADSFDEVVLSAVFTKEKRVKKVIG